MDSANPSIAHNIVVIVMFVEDVCQYLTQS